jgi:Protein of unknown function (DUF3237)
MESLTHRHLTTLTLDVDFAGVTPIGAIPAGHRGIAPVIGGRFEGERLSGTVAPGHDWFVTRPDGVLVIDVRLTLKTDDGATIYLAYGGRMTGSGDAMARFRRGERLAPEDYSLTIAAKFECGDPRYAWLNDAIVVGSGAQTPTGPVYTLFEVGA